MRSSVKIFLFCLSAIAFISFDRVTKTIAKARLMNVEPLSYFHDTFRLEYTENKGAFLSVGNDLPNTTSFWLFGILPLLFLLILFGYTIKNAKKLRFIKMFCFALIFAGGLGNIIDRIAFDRHVTDFMNVGINNLRTGVFNFADMCITAGAIGLLLFFNDKKVIAKAGPVNE